MCILSKLAGHVVVDDGLDTLDIETTRCQVSSEQVVYTAGFEIVERIETLLCQ